MSLTEEQRAALKRVVAYMDEMYAIASPYHGCTEDANILRAMIDSSGTVEPVGGFDLERAREAIEEAVDRLSQKIGDEDGPIWEKEPEKAAVLQTLPDEIAHLEKWMIKNRDAATELQYQLDDAIKEDERLRSAIKTYREREESAFSEIKMKDEFLMRQNARIKELEAEIERLRAIIDTPSEEPEWVVDFKKLNRFAGAGYSLIDIEIAKKWHTAYRKAQNSNLLRKQEIERLRASLIDLHAEYINTLEKNPECSAWDLDEQSDADQKRLRRNAAHAISIVEPPIYLQAEQRATKIKELEDVHKRSGVKYAKIINELRSSVYANIPGLKKQWDEILNTPANDKIGPSEEQIRAKMAELPSTPGPYRPAIREEAIRQLDVKPRSWQITEKRKAAIKELSELLTAIGCPSCHYYIQKNYGENITVLRAMLTEADHDKP